MATLKSERHHWWPVSVSDRWKDAEGCVHWLLPDGHVRRIPPKNLGAIGNGHHIRLGRDPPEASVWDQTFEKEFQRADDSFPELIDWLGSLHREERASERLPERFVAQDVQDERLGTLMECLVSLVVRSPRSREGAVSLAEHLRGPLPERERNGLIGLNLCHNQRTVTQALGTSGKFVVIHSPKREFIFGDGFFHNITPQIPAMHNPKMLVPLTPALSVLFARPTTYMTNPKLMTLVIRESEADRLNLAVQVYARNAIFYRVDKPVIAPPYQEAKHLTFASHENPVDRLIDMIPGVPARDTSLYETFERARRWRDARSEK